MERIATPPTRRARYSHRIPRERLSTILIQSDDPTYLPPTHRQVAELAEMIKVISLQMPDVLQQSFAQGEGPESSTKTMFGELAATWREESAFCSSLLEMVTRPSYQRIIGLGRSAIPHILAALSQQPDHWFWALKAITGEDPVPPEDRGNLQRMTQAWLIWGVRNGYEF
jgi:hypothetical protein